MVDKREEKKTFKTKKEKKFHSWTSKVNLEYGKKFEVGPFGQHEKSSEN